MPCNKLAVQTAQLTLELGLLLDNPAAILHIVHLWTVSPPSVCIPSPPWLSYMQYLAGRPTHGHTHLPAHRPHARLRTAGEPRRTARWLD